MKLTLDQVEALAPDAGTLTRAKKIAKPNKYKDVGADERAIWAVALGSSTYETFIDIQGPAYKCSCPVNKMPCKHAMGLMVLVAQEPAVAKGTEPPEAVSAWLAKRDGAAKAKLDKVAGQVKDPAAQAKRAQQRESNVEKGIEELRRFLEDSVRMGLAESAKRSQDVWDQMQKRLIDAQARGLSRMLDWIRREMGNSPNWTDSVFRALLRLHALVSAYENREQLPPELVEDIRERIGWSKSKEQVLQSQPIAGPWLVMNHATRYESGLYTQTIWLLQQATGELRRVLNFATDFNRETLQGGYRSGTLINGNAYDFSSWSPQRVILERPSAFDYEEVEQWDWLEPFAASDIASAMHSLQRQRIHHPFQEAWPLLIRNVRLVTKDDQLALVDRDRRLLMVDPTYPRPWQLLSAMGKDEATVFMITFDGQQVIPWAVRNEQRWHAINMNEMN